MEIVWPSQILKLSFAFIRESFFTFKTFTLIICKQIKLQQTSSSNEPQRDELQRDEPEPQRTAILYTINCTYTVHILAFIPHPFPPCFPQTCIFSFVFEIPNALSFLVTVASLDKIEMKNNLKKIQARPIKAATACHFDQSSTCKIAPSTPMPLLVLYLHTT